LHPIFPDKPDLFKVSGQYLKRNESRSQKPGAGIKKSIKYFTEFLGCETRVSLQNPFKFLVLAVKQIQIFAAFFCTLCVISDQYRIFNNDFYKLYRVLRFPFTSGMGDTPTRVERFWVSRCKRDYGLKNPKQLVLNGSCLHLDYKVVPPNRLRGVFRNLIKILSNIHQL
jgi:hypothetical protein